MKAIAMTSDGTVLATTRAPTVQREAQGGNCLSLEHRICEMLRRFIASIADEIATQPAGIGVVVPGVLDEAAGLVHRAVNLGWNEIALRDLIERDLVDHRLDIPIQLGHDVRQGGLAEGRLGAARGVDDYAFVPIGTGIAMSVVLGGKLRRGSHGLDGEIGHVAVGHGASSCRCGGHRCLETVASAASISRRYRERGGQDLCASEIWDRRGLSDDRADAVWRDAIAALADVLASVNAALDVNTIVIGGGVSSIGAPLADLIASGIRDRLALGSGPVVVPAAFCDNSGAVGAALLSIDASGQKERRS